jgi:hypothetical protein
MVAEDKVKIYECSNEVCVLGVPGVHGHFSGGATAEQVMIKTGEPAENLKEGKDFGEGICPECGTKGKHVGELESPGGKDELEEAHKKADKVASPKIANIRKQLNDGDISPEEFEEQAAEISAEAQAVVEKEGAKA